MAGLYIKIFHSKNDDPAGFLALCIAVIFISVAVAAAVTKLEKVLQNAIDMRTENDFTI